MLRLIPVRERPRHEARGNTKISCLSVSACDHRLQCIVDPGVGMDTEWKRSRDDQSFLTNDVKRVRTEDEPSAHHDLPASIDEAIATPPLPIPPSGTAPIDAEEEEELIRPAYYDHTVPVSRLGLKPTLPELPPSLELVTGVKTDLRARRGFVGQEEVGIIGYAGPVVLKGVKGVIKQR